MTKFVVSVVGVGEGWGVVRDIIKHEITPDQVSHETWNTVTVSIESCQSESVKSCIKKKKKKKK